MSSPSRPASQALMMSPTSLRRQRRRTCLRRVSDCSIGCSSNLFGIAGSTSKFQGRLRGLPFFPIGPWGILSSTRWPTAEVTTKSLFSKYISRPLPFFSNFPTSGALASARDRSVATDGFSAMMSVFDMEGGITLGRASWKEKTFVATSFLLRRKKINLNYQK